MNFFHNINTYDHNSVWSQEVLASIRPEDIVNYFAKIAFGTLNPSGNTRARLRVNTINDKKKAISFFMVNRTTKWNEVQLSGNPTRSTHESEFIKYMKLKEVRLLGRPSQATRPMEPTEFVLTINQLNTYQNDGNPRRTVERRYMIPAALKFQFHLIAWVDDTFHFYRKI
jgi:hypothetical protein